MKNSNAFKTKNLKFTSEQHQGILSESFLSEMQLKNYDMSFRMDQFDENTISEYIYFALVASTLTQYSLSELERIIENLPKDQHSNMKLPKVVGMIPYEQASEFLPLKWSDNIYEGVCIIPRVLLAIHKVDKCGILYDMTGLMVESDIFLIERDILTVCENIEKKKTSFAQKCAEKVNAINDFDEMLRYQNMFAQSKAHIFEGDIFQVVLSRKFNFQICESPYAYYLDAMQNYNLPYNCFMNVKSGRAYAITSPEMLVRYDEANVYTRPIAGTRPIKNDGRDLERQVELRNDIKENAEHLMLVDLGRNDLSKVCKSGSVKINFYKEVRAYHKVYHMVSEVVGERNFKKIFDPIRATFPAGTVSGAPKISAMQIIKNLEHDSRGSYAGATYVIDTQDEFKSCINIRSASFNGDMITLQVGSGIVSDAVVDDEYKELVNKIRGPLEKFGR